MKIGAKISEIIKKNKENQQDQNLFFLRLINLIILYPD